MLIAAFLILTHVNHFKPSFARVGAACSGHITWIGVKESLIVRVAYGSLRACVMLGRISLNRRVRLYQDVGIIVEIDALCNINSLRRCNSVVNAHILLVYKHTPDIPLWNTPCVVLQPTYRVIFSFFMSWAWLHRPGRKQSILVNAVYISKDAVDTYWLRLPCTASWTGWICVGKTNEGNSK